MRRIVRNLLKELGFANVDEAEDGAVALQKLLGGGFDFELRDSRAFSRLRLVPAEGGRSST